MVRVHRQPDRAGGRAGIDQRQFALVAVCELCPAHVPAGRGDTVALRLTHGDGRMMLLLMGCVLFLGAALQSTVGFGFALFVVPLLVLLDVPLPMAISLSVIGALPQRIHAIGQLRTHVPWAPLKTLIVTGLLGVPLGALLFRLFSVGSHVVLQQIIGLLIVVLVVAKANIKIRPRDNVAFPASVTRGHAVRNLDRPRQYRRPAGHSLGPCP